jgi:ATP phosphoribosyltransferase
VAVPNAAAPQSFDDLEGLRLATSHPRATAAAFERLGVRIDIVTISGAVEVAPRMGLADGIVDLVSSGSTLLMNGLRSLGPLLASQAILVGPRQPKPGTEDAAGELRTMLEAVIAGRKVKYLMMNAPVGAVPAIEAILPGLESPSVLPLAHQGMVAVHAVVSAPDVHRILVPLRAAGATGILVVPVEKLLP